MNKTPFHGAIKRYLVQLSRCYSRADVKVLKKSLDLKVETVFEKHKNSIYYSSYIEDNIVKLGYQKNQALKSYLLSQVKDETIDFSRIKSFPLALKHLEPGTESSIEDLTKRDDNLEMKHNTIVLSEETLKRVSKPDLNQDLNEESNERAKLNWMTDYEFFKDNNDDSLVPYGTPDPTATVSDVECGGCGARLHCAQESLPGYIPSEIYKGRTDKELKTIVCQRCHFLENYNTALKVSVQPEEYAQLLSTIKDKHGLIVLIVDLLDIPCSIWPNILDIVGRNRPIFIVGNKIDLIPKDSRGYLGHIRQNLIQNLINRGIPEKNVKHISLISATTGYGVEELITALHNKWGRDGDVFLIGVTNSGKSSLFNALLRSDYCKVQASDLVRRATASPWPGTTLRMLKFPILRISDARQYLRTMRLVSERSEKRAEETLRQIQAKETGKVEHATLMGHIRQTFTKFDPEEANSFAIGKNKDDIFSLNEQHKDFVNSKWCFDTPGVISPDQIHSLLTIEELLLVQPKEMMRPRAFLMKPGMSLFLAGIGRVDFIKVYEFVISL